MSEVSETLRTRRCLGVVVVLLCSVLLIGPAGCSRNPSDAPPPGSPASGQPSASVEPTVEPTPTPSLAGTVKPPERGAYLGVYTPPAPFQLRRIDAFEAQTGKDVAIVMWYQPWASANRSRVDSGAIVGVWRRGKVPMITWEPWDPGTNANMLKDPANQPAYRLKTIIAGRHDAYIRSWARGLRDLGGPVMLRPMQEMNGSWYPWCGTVNGNTPSEYVVAWRHVHRIFDQEGATNVTWVWSINHESVPGTKANRYAAYYPGDGYVDWTAASGFNWGTSAKGTRWRMFSHWYDEPLAYLKTLPKPICIAEIGTVENGGDKAAWIADAYRRVAAAPRIRAVIYYDALERSATNVQNWRIDSSRRSVSAFRRAVSPPYYRADVPTALKVWSDSLDTRQWNYLISLPTLY